ncbi:hypothetical protein ACFV24_02675 [Nocardia fluminea]|uniref:hypothetical protein n=1 Tax=Nocardia fluminea TaxID=134984 RepID=UPI00366F7FDD
MCAATFWSPRVALAYTWSLRRAARDGARASPVLHGQHELASSDSFLGVLPGSGRSNETLIVHTHTDGMEAFEDRVVRELIAQGNDEGLAAARARGGASAAHPQWPRNRSARPARS